MKLCELKMYADAGVQNRCFRYVFILRNSDQILHKISDIKPLSVDSAKRDSAVLKVTWAAGRIKASVQ